MRAAMLGTVREKGMGPRCLPPPFGIFCLPQSPSLCGLCPSTINTAPRKGPEIHSHCRVISWGWGARGMQEQVPGSRGSIFHFLEHEH